MESEDDVHKEASAVEGVTSRSVSKGDGGPKQQKGRRKPQSRLDGETPSASDACVASSSAGVVGQSQTRVHRAEGWKKFTCKHCPKTFKSRSGLRHHILVHDGIKRHECAVCDKAFTDASQLKRHILTHTGERPHNCPVCGASFARAEDLRRHMLTHTGEKSHQCKTCGKSFARAFNLRQHEMIHTGKVHQCQLCQKSFAQRAGLHQHMMIHTGEKRFQCEVCQKSFARGSDWKLHVVFRSSSARFAGKHFHGARVCRGTCSSTRVRSHIDALSAEASSPRGTIFAAIIRSTRLASLVRLGELRPVPSMSLRST